VVRFALWPSFCSGGRVPTRGRVGAGTHFECCIRSSRPGERPVIAKILRKHYQEMTAAECHHCEREHQGRQAPSGVLQMTHSTRWRPAVHPQGAARDGMRVYAG